jgi:hypothetical protein
MTNGDGAPRVAWTSADGRGKLWHADCLDVLANAPDGCIDAVVTDPPYELGFMGKGWDASGIAYSVELWRQCLRVLKPGGHLLAFGGTRTYHRMACAIEDAGFEIRDSLHWVYGSGFPKGQDVGKAIDKAAGAQRQVIGERPWTNARMTAGHGISGLRQAGGFAGEYADGERVAVPVTGPATQDAVYWDGWNTALKPAHEPIVLARKPLAGTVAANVVEHGTGAINVGACRVGEGDRPLIISNQRSGNNTYGDGLQGSLSAGQTSAGRWPTNILLTHDPDCVEDGACADGCPVAEMDGQSSGASRFFPVFRYQAKAPAKERPKLADGTAHATVKPVALMRWLVRLVTPPDGVVLDPFAGSGTTLQAALAEGFRVIGVEREEAYTELCVKRLEG